MKRQASLVSGLKGQPYGSSLRPTDGHPKGAISLIHSLQSNESSKEITKNTIVFLIEFKEIKQIERKERDVEDAS